MKAVAFALAVALMAVSCGGDAAAQAQAFTLRLEDFAEDWAEVEDAPEDDETIAALEEAEAACWDGFSDRIEDEHESPSFSRSEFVTAGSQARVLEGSDTAEAVVAGYEAIVRCYEASLVPVFEEQAAASGVDVQLVPFYEVRFPAVGEHAAAWTMQFGSPAFSVFIDLVVVQSARGLLEVFFTNDGTLDVEEEADIMRSAAERMPGG